MATFADLLGDLHRDRFVGRTAELAACEQWLRDADGPPILAVSGAGGIGKSWLLEEFGRRAQADGWVTHRFDAAASDGGVRIVPDVGYSAAGPNTAGTVVIVDAVDALGPSIGELQRELAELYEGIRVVLSSRRPLRDGPWRAWEPLMRYLELGAFGWDEQCRYLDLRGVDDHSRRQEVLMRTGGHPLTLSLAVDLIVSAGVAEFVGSPVWRSAVHMTVEQLMGEVGPSFRPAVEAAAVLHRFDRAALVAVLGIEQADSAFVRLCSLSATRVVGDRLALHDDARSAVVEDLRLHHPQRLDEIRRAALRHYRHAAAVGGQTGARWSIERLHLVGRDVLGVSFLYDEHPTLTVAPASPADRPEMMALLRDLPHVPGVPAVESDPARVARILADPHCVTHLARDFSGALRGYGFYLHLTETNRKLLGDGDAMARLIDAAAERLGCPDGRFPAQSNVYYLSTVVMAEDDIAVGAVLGNNVLDLLLAEGAYIAVPARPWYVNMTAGFMMQPLQPEVTEAGVPLLGRMLDLSRCGFATWVRTMMAGRTLDELPIGPALTAVVSAAVTGFDDDSTLAGSVLAPMAEPADELPPPVRARAVRELLARGLHAEGAWPTPELRIGDALAAAAIAELPRVPEPPAVGAASTPPARNPDRQVGGLHVRMLGGFAVSRDGIGLQVPQGAVATAIKILALRRAVVADELIEALWPGAGQSAGRDRLRNLLSRIRRAVDPNLVMRDGVRILLAESVLVDAEAFETAANEALGAGRDTGAGTARRLAAAAAEYRGELLPGERYSEWAVAPRERLARLHLDLLDRLAADAQDAGDADEAIRRLEQAIDADPYDEDRYLRAAELLAAGGHRGRALALVQRAQSAAAALGVPLAAPLAHLHRRLRAAG